MTPLEKRSDEDLVDAVRDRPPEAAAALETLLGRYQRRVCGRITHSVRDVRIFLMAVMRASMEDFCGDLLGQAIRGFRRSGGAKFSTYLFTIVSNALTSAHRAPAPPLPTEGRDRHPDSGVAPGSPAHLAALEALETSRACLAGLDARSREIFVWTALLGFTPAEVREYLPKLSEANIRQIKARATAKFVVAWQRRGGERVERMLEVLPDVMAGRIDPDRIRDAKAREAYLAWRKSGDAAKAAEAAGVSDAVFRKRLLAAMNDLFDQTMLRGRPAEVGRRLAAGERELAAWLELGEDERPRHPVYDRLLACLDAARAAFGLADLHGEPLGAFVQRRLESPEDYERARGELGLSAAELRRLLSGDLDPAAPLLGRLAAFCGTPPERLRAMPRRSEGRETLRADGTFDEDRFRARVGMWLRRPKRR